MAVPGANFGGKRVGSNGLNYTIRPRRVHRDNERFALNGRSGFHVDSQSHRESLLPLLLPYTVFTHG